MNLDISKSNYEHCKQVVLQYEDLQKRLSRVNGRSKCPFCGGTKTTPFISPFKNQNCTDCDKNGMISNRKLVEMELDDCIEKNK